MATHLDLEEQEQLDQLKHFWSRWGNLITWVLILIFGGLAAWNGWNWYQRDQAVKASAMYDELDRAAKAGDADKAARVFDDLKARYGGTTYAAQGGLLAGKAAFDKSKLEAARGALGWVAENASEPEYQAIARLRLAGVLLDDKKYDEALRQLDGVKGAGFEALAADRRGDVLLAQGQRDAAKAAYRKAWDGMPATLDYRRLVEAKLTSLGAAPEAPAAASAASGARS